MGQKTLEEAIHLRHSGQTTEAKKIFQELIDRGSDMARANYYLGLILENEGQSDKAEARYERAIQKNPEYHQAYNNLGLLLMRRNQDAKATAVFLKSHALAPNDAPPLVNLGTIYYKRDDYARSLDYFEKVPLGNLPDGLRDEILLKMGDAYLKCGRGDQSERIYQAMLQRDPKNAVVLNNLGYLYLEVKHDYAAATKYIDQSLALNSEFRPANQNKGLILKNMEKYAEAVVYLKKAIALDPTNFEGYYNLGCTAALMGDEPTAQAQLLKSVEMAPFLKNHAHQDTDYKRYWNATWFKDAIK